MPVPEATLKTPVVSRDRCVSPGRFDDSGRANEEMSNHRSTFVNANLSDETARECRLGSSQHPYFADFTCYSGHKNLLWLGGFNEYVTAWSMLELKPAYEYPYLNRNAFDPTTRPGGRSVLASCWSNAGIRDAVRIGIECRANE
ncbi:MAG: hypothetical protein HZA46_09330 [Planctomycetales bacterium]|nr:hypothetical protein [Planctomycetales bacterium]